MTTPTSSNPRFAIQTPSAEESLKGQTVGLVHLDDFRKRRRNVEDLRSNESGTVTPNPDASDADTTQGLKKKKPKTQGRKLLSFGDGDEPEQDTDSKAVDQRTAGQDSLPNFNNSQGLKKRKSKINPNTGVPAPKAMTKASIAAEAAERDRLRIDFIKAQEQVRNTEIAVPFVFYDGSSLPGGIVKVKKGEHIWLFLERCRKLGAEIGVSSEGSVEGGGSKQRVDGKKSWARIGVDDLMLIRGGIIVPHHYEFYYFILNKIADPGQPERLLFDYSSGLNVTDEGDEQSRLRLPKDAIVEGRDDDAAYTKVVDRRWYEKNKHIYPASIWREYKTGKEHEELMKGQRDAQGNAFFFT